MPTKMSQSEFESRWSAAEVKVCAFLRAGCRDAEMIDDLLQEVAIAAWKKRDDYEPERPFAAWVVGIARFALLRQRRDVARQRVILAPELIDQLESYAIDDAETDRQEALAHCVSQLDEASQTLLQLKYQSKLPLADAAERMGRSHGAVRTALSRLRDRLRNCILRQLDLTTGKR